MYLSEFHNAKETKEVLEKGSTDVYFKWYHKKKRDHHPGVNTVKKTNEEKMTLTKLAKIVVDGFSRVNTRIDNIETRIDNLEKDINTRIDRVETRIDRIDARLDYIVEANNLKDSK